MNMRWKMAQYAEIRWWQGYLRQKPKTAYLDWKRAYWISFLEKIGVQVPPQATVLDAGCGPAGIFTILEQQQVTAIDPLLDAYAEKLPHFRQTDYPHTTFFCESIEKFVPQTTFDYVFCLNAINHVADLEKSLDNLVAFTKQGGSLVVSIDAHNYALFKQVFRLVPGDILHPHQHDLADYQAMLLQHNIAIRDTVLIKKEFLFNYHTIVGIKK